MTNFPHRALVLAILALGCGVDIPAGGEPDGSVPPGTMPLPPPPPPDIETPDSGDPSDAGVEVDSGALDAGSVLGDAGKADAGKTDASVFDAGQVVDAGPELVESFVSVPATGPYGTRTFVVPARANWVNTGLFLKAGQTFAAQATGTWKTAGSTAVGPAGSMSSKVRGCQRGALTARMGLTYDDASLLCVGDGGTFSAPRDGIVYMGAIIGSDLGDTYEARRNVSGAVSVTLTSTGDTVPTVSTASIAGYSFASLKSGWVELRGTHVLVTVPASVAIADRATAPAALNFLDAVYAQHAVLRGAVPHGGARIRFFPDAEMAVRGWYMLAGNPVRMDPTILTGAVGTAHILKAADVAYDAWGFAHELGHDFTFVDGLWWYQVDSLEAWPNIFTVKTLRALKRRDFVNCKNDINCPTSVFCAGKAAQLSSGTYATFKADPFLELCFLLEFDDVYGATFYRKYFDALNLKPTIPSGSPTLTWGWVRDQFNAASGANTTARFTSWKVPVP